MSHRPEPINAIIYAQYQLRGGLRNTLIGAGVGALFVGGACVMGISMNENHTRDVARAATFVILALQWLVLGLYGTTRVSAAVRQDVNSGIIESHRLTPTNPMTAALGYIFGAPVQAIALAVVLFLIGGVMCVIGNLPIQFWIVANAMTLASSMTAWTLVALVAFAASHGAVMPLMAIASVLFGTLFMIVPAMAVLTAPLTGRSVFNFASPQSTMDLPPAYAFTLASQALLAGVMLIAIARRYRNADTPAFSVRLGLVLLTMWTAITIIGLAQAELFVPTFMLGGDRSARLIAGFVSSMLIALVPLTSIARAVSRPAESGERRLSAWLLLPVCVLLAWLPACVELVGHRSEFALPLLGTAGVMLAMFVGVALLLAWQFLGGRGGWALTFLFVALPNALPPLAAALLDSVQDSNLARSTYDTIVGFSPMGALILLWDSHPDRAVTGIIGQLLLTVLPASLYLTRLRKTPEVARGFPVRLTTPPPLPQNADLPRV